MPVTNLPAQFTSFIGREREIAEAQHLLTSARLLTLTGPGGCGKTRLSIEVASALATAHTFADGVCWVELAALADPELVPQAVALALQIREQSNRPTVEVIAGYLQSKHVLLLLDNCEHLVQVCAQLADALLRHCPRLHILATSREPLNVTGETTWVVPSLSLPELEASDQGSAAPDLVQAEVVRLFVERARAIQPDFTLSSRTRELAAARICQQLDGMPLAIELAAACVKSLSPEQIAARLNDRFCLLTRGSRVALPRHQTLRAAIDWSHNLLSDEERMLLRRLAVFAGGFSLDAVEAGVVLLLVTGTTGIAGGAARADIRGYALALLGVLSASFAAVYTRRRLQQVGVLLLTAGQMATGLLVVAPLALALTPVYLWAVSWRGWLAVIYSGAIGSAFAFLLFFWLVKRFGASTAVLPGYVLPAVSVGLGALLLGEVITPALLAGAGLTLVGVFLASRADTAAGAAASNTLFRPAGLKVEGR